MHTDCNFIVRKFELLEASLPGYVNSNGNNNISKRKIYIYSNEGNIPHCHYIDKTNNREICVRLDKAEYFTHGNKKKIFTKDEKKMFIQFMTSEVKNIKGYTEWDLAVEYWNNSAEDNNNMIEIKTKEIPDYSKLETEK